MATHRVDSPRLDRTGRRLQRRISGGLTAIGICLTALVAAATQSPAEPAEGPLNRHANLQLQKLAQHEGTLRAPRELLIRNLSRYFVRYLLPSNREELNRVLGTAERMTARTVAQLYRILQTAADETGIPVVSDGYVGGLLQNVLPSRPTPYGELSFFPDGPDGGRLAIETIDLQAFADTGFCWGVLASIDEEALAAGTETVPLAPEAIDALHGGINAYTLLLFRLAGLYAKSELASHVQSRHLRTAGKALDSGSIEALLPPRPTAPTGGPLTDVTIESGLRFRHVTSDWLSAYRRYGPIAPSFSGGGISAGDLDGDGWDDLVICGGKGCAAFRNRRDGTFEDVTAASGIAIPGEARMTVIADFDNDGDRDLFITYARDTNRLLENDGRGVFRDATLDSGLERPGDISGPAAAVDVDNDGLLDLYVGNFGDYLSGETPFKPLASTNGMPNRLYLNLGALKFDDVSAESGISGTGWSQALSHCDLDLDGDQDLYVANDFGSNELLRNDGRGRFESSGVASGSDDRFHGMNVAFADVNHDRFPDVMVTNIWSMSPLGMKTTETNSLLLSKAGEGPPTYEKFSGEDFLGHDTGWSWAAQFFDLDNDADDDLFVANGFTDYLTFVQKRPHPEAPGQLYPINNGSEANWLFRRDGTLTFTPVPSSAALDGINSRGVALLDYDRDGDLDLAISTFHSQARLFRNDAPPPGTSWLTVELVGDPQRSVNRDAIGAQLVVTDENGLYVWRAITGGDGYLSTQSLPLEFGLGDSQAVDLEILWPNGETQSLEDVPANRTIRVHQGQNDFETLLLE